MLDQKFRLGIVNLLCRGAVSAPALPSAIVGGRYRLIHLLGEGPRKQVYLAHDDTLERDVALAFLKTAEEFPRGQVEVDARSMARLAGHPGIVTVHDIGEDEGALYVVSECIVGGTIASLLERSEGHRLASDEALRIARQVCLALEHAHRHGVVHRALKPSSVWLTAEGIAKVGDFALGSPLDSRRCFDRAEIIDTMTYASPEQVVGREVDSRSDLYSLGCMLYEMIAGRPPFLGDDAVTLVSCHLHEEPIPPSRLRPEVPQALDEIVLRLLAKSCDDRPHSASLVASQLQGIAAAAPKVATLGTEREGAADGSPPGGVFVGRKAELGRLEEGLEEALAGRGRLFMLVGEAGIGKTRTAEQLAANASRRGARALVGRCYEGEGAPPLWPWLQILRSYLAAREPSMLESEIGPVAGEIAQVIPEMRQSFGNVPPPPVGEPEEARFRLFESVATFFKSVARHEPLVIILDDLHWADRSSLLLLQFLARGLAESALLVIGTYRDIELQYEHPLAEVLSVLRREAIFERILLHGLPEGDVRALISALGGQNVPTSFARAVFTQSEGNPFFIEELLRHLVEDGVLDREAGRRTSRMRPEEMDIPESVRETIGRRLTRLSATCQRLLAVGAVIGREFDPVALARVAEVDTEPLLEALEEASAARVIGKVRGPDGTARYCFSHALVRETLCGRLGTNRRIRWHRRAAEVVEALYAGNLEPHLGELAHHFFESASGGDVEKAFDYSLRAGDRAIGALAFEEAAGHYQRALEASELGRARSRAARCELRLKLGDARWRAAQFDHAKESFRRAAEIAATPAELARAALGYGGHLAFDVGFVDETLVELLERALAVCPEDSATIRVRLMARLAETLAYSPGVDPRRPTSLVEEAVRLARRGDDPSLLAYALAAEHCVTWTPDNLPERIRRTDEIVALAERARERRLVALGHLWRASHRLETGDVASARPELAALEECAHALEQPYLRWMAANTQAMNAFVDGRLAESERIAERALAIGQEEENHNAAQMFTAQLLFLRWEQGRLGQFADAVAAFAERLPAIPAWRCALTWIYAETGRHAEAREQLDRLAANDFRGLARDQFWLVGMWCLAEAVNQLGDARRAESLYGLMLPFAERSVTVSTSVFAGALSRSLGLLALTQRRFDLAESHLRTALEAHVGMDAKPLVARTRCDLARVLLARDLRADREEAVSLLEQTLALAQRLEMKAVAERALTLQLQGVGIEAADPKSSIDAVTASVESKRPELRVHAAPDGTVTLLFSDMEGFSAMTERLGDERALRVMQAHNAIVRAAIREHGGYEVEVQGDGFLIAFSTASRALECAVRIQEALAAYGEAHPDQPIAVRIGLHTGEPIVEGNRFFGKTVIVASRIATAARGGEILVSSLVREFADDGRKFRFDDGREIEITGLAGTHLVYGVPWSSAPRAPQTRSPTPPPSLHLIDGNVFRRSGDYWTIVYRGATARVRDSKGVRYVARLLRHPDRELHVADLLVERGPRADEPEAAAIAVGISADLGHAGEILDSRARAEYEKRRASLEAQVETAIAAEDLDRAAPLQQELEFLTRELAAARGLGGRSRKNGDTAERMRKAVGSRIRESIGRIGKEHATLGSHLASTIRVGTFCCYAPRGAIDWDA